jgi:lipid-A-disaccharide synthase
MGFVDVFFALPKLIRHFYFLAKTLLANPPKAAVFIDYPGLHLRLESYLRKKGFQGKIIHYICPSVWAHGKGRIAEMEKNLDLLLTLFPFEKSLFSPSLPVCYVGHPLVSRIESSSPPPLAWAHGKKVISLFPGSRKKEISLNLPLQLKALKRLLSKETLGAISISQQAHLPLIQSYLEKEGLLLNDSIYLVPSQDTYALMQCSYFSIAKSGTVTLELALHQVPTVVVYGIAPLDFFIAKYLLRISLPFYCIVNIVAGKEIFKELIGPALTEKALYEETDLFLDPSYYHERKKLLQEVLLHLGKKKASLEAARQIIEQIEKTSF